MRAEPRLTRRRTTRLAEVSYSGQARRRRKAKGTFRRFTFSSAGELLKIGERHKLAIWEIALQNEKTWHSEEEVLAYVRRIWKVMQECVRRGLETEGILPGGLNVRRRAPRLAKKLKAPGSGDPLTPMDWVNAYAMAVNEENAAGGRV